MFGLTFIFNELDDSFWLSKEAVIETVPESSSNVAAEEAQDKIGESLSTICIVFARLSPNWSPLSSPVTPVIVYVISSIGSFSVSEEAATVIVAVDCPAAIVTDPPSTILSNSVS